MNGRLPVGIEYVIGLPVSLGLWALVVWVVR